MKKILQNAGLTESELRTMSLLCDGSQSAKSMARVMGWSHYVSSNRIMGRIGKKVHLGILQSAPKKSPIRDWRGDGGGLWFCVIAPGKTHDDGELYWYLRPEVREAFLSLGLYVSVSPSGLSQPEFEPRPEGAEIQRLISTHERDPSLRAQCLKIHGHHCKICEINLGSIYGKLGEDFIHVHHLSPLSRGRQPRRTDPNNDLIPVCPNCHSMIHRGGACRSPLEVQSAMKSHNNAPRSRVT